MSEIILNVKQLIDSLGSVDEQREMILLKFNDIDREECTKLSNDFKYLDTCIKGELTEHQALLLLEDRNLTKTATELRYLLRNMSKSDNKCISFVELACGIFNKNFDELNNFSDEDAKERARQLAKEQEEKVKLVEEETKRKREEEEQNASIRAAELEAESKLTGVAGMKAFFKRQAENVQDVTKTNEQKIKEEALLRKQMREEKLKLQQALEDASKIKTADDVKKEVEIEAARRQEIEEKKHAEKVAEERRLRAEKAAMNNSKWGGGSVPSPSKPIHTVNKNNPLPLRS